MLIPQHLHLDVPRVENGLFQINLAIPEASPRLALRGIQGGLQLFGAMGFTWENELHLYLKRAAAGDLLLGGASEHRKAILALSQEASHEDSKHALAQEKEVAA